MSLYNDIYRFILLAFLTYFNMKEELEKIETGEDKTLADKLGFYFVVFQKDYWTNCVKCWLDGSEDYIFYTVDEMRSFASMTKSLTLLHDLEQTFNDTGIFIWDVEGGYIKRLNARSGIDKGIIEHVLEKGEELKKPVFNNPFVDLFSILKDKIEIKK